jgi:aldehyde dehydrogenase (NAD+)
MYEQYHPLGIVGIISAFNFPVAVWSWNTALAWICGDVCIWKPSEKTPFVELLVKILSQKFLKKIICLKEFQI